MPFITMGAHGRIRSDDPAIDRLRFRAWKYPRHALSGLGNGTALAVGVPVASAASMAIPVVGPVVSALIPVIAKLFSGPQGPTTAQKRAGWVAGGNFKWVDQYYGYVGDGRAGPLQPFPNVYWEPYRGKTVGAYGLVPSKIVTYDYFDDFMRDANAASYAAGKAWTGATPSMDVGGQASTWLNNNAIRISTYKQAMTVGWSPKENSILDWSGDRALALEMQQNAAARAPASPQAQAQLPVSSPTAVQQLPSPYAYGPQGSETMQPVAQNGGRGGGPSYYTQVAGKIPTPVLIGGAVLIGFLFLRGRK